MQFNDKQRKEMLEAAKPLMRWLEENTHPHAKAEVNSTDVILYEGVITARLPDTNFDQTSVLPEVLLGTPPNGLVWLPNLYGHRPKHNPQWQIYAVRYKSGKEVLVHEDLDWRLSLNGDHVVQYAIVPK